MYSLIQHIKSICGNRDALSLFVEYCGDNQIRVHRQFYNYNQFVTFFVENDPNTNQLDYKDVTCDIGFDEFRILLYRLINKRNKNNNDEQFIEELRGVLDRVNFLREIVRQTHEIHFIVTQTHRILLLFN